MKFDQLLVSTCLLRKLKFVCTLGVNKSNKEKFIIMIYGNPLK